MISERLPFRLQARATGSRARAAVFTTLHNEVQTPLFMPVGTQATVKAQLPEMLAESGSQILLANTYHLLLRPGPEVFQRCGGIHGFMTWDRSVLTDSGGFQIFSLPHSRSMTEAGAVFQSYVDGATILLSPEVSIATQRAIGSDIMMALDQCIPSTADKTAARAALAITHRWAARSLAARGDSPQSIFAIVQGALFEDLRRESAAGLTEMPFEGYAIGGLAVGEEKHQREDVCASTAELLPADRPRYLMGVGTPLDLLEAVHRGVDMFDCIIPTQMAKRGTVFTSRGIVQLRRSVYKFSSGKLDPACGCPTCARYSRAYLHHLNKTQESLGWQLLGQHNIWFYHQLMREIRAAILEDRFLPLYEEKRLILDVDDVEHPPVNAPASLRKPVRSSKLGDYEVHQSKAGFSSIRHTPSGEIMHSVSPPMEEAEALYTGQCRLAERLRGDGPPLVIWDAGMGAASNAMAAVLTWEAEATAGPVRPLEIVSFENDLDSLRLALRHKHLFAWLRHAAPEAISAHGHWESTRTPGLRWRLLSGDFQECITTAPALPDVIFFDLYSSRTQADAWSVAAFSRLFAVCGSVPVALYTYTTSTAARAALLAAGFYVARGCATGLKTETTIALTPSLAVAPPHPLLGQDWLAKWHRSQARFPAGMPDVQQAEFSALITGHPQFFL